jgi:hypothetical protein
MIRKPSLDKETEASHIAPLTDILKPVAGPFHAPGNTAGEADGLAKRIVVPGANGSQTLYICMEIATLSAPGLVDAKVMEAVNKGNSETNAHSVQESNKLAALE